MTVSARNAISINVITRIINGVIRRPKRMFC